ncbi:MAG: O-antigen ligase domain-containing protein [Cyanobacteria bacterium P01_A01_bin.123]
MALRNDDLPRLFQPAIPWIAISVLFLVTVLAVIARAGAPLRLLYPLLAVAVGLLLHLRYPLLYLSYNWWIWLMTPLVRRLADYYGGGYQEPSIVLLTPPVVSMIAVITVTRSLPQLLTQSAAVPFVLCTASVGYATLIGLLQNDATGTIVTFLGWLPPLVSGTYLYMLWPHYPQIARNLQRTMVWGVLVLGIYGVVQYWLAPAWDTFWLRNSESFAFGTPEPLGIRVWSTLNSPQPFGVVMMAGLLLLFSRRSALSFGAASVGYLSFLLCSARAAWLGWMGGMVFFLPSLRSSLQIRLIASLMMMVLAVVPLTVIEPFSSAILPRLESLSSPNEDISFNARMDAYDQLFGEALSEGVGNGLGFVIAKEGFGSNDSGMLSLLFSFGWIGTLPYVSGIALILINALKNPHAKSDPFLSASRAIVIGTLVQVGLNVVFTRMMGMVLWSFLGSLAAANQYYRHQHVPDLDANHSGTTEPFTFHDSASTLRIR